MEVIVLIAGAIAYLTTVLVYKDGPYKIFQKFRMYVSWKLGENNPFTCTICASFWVCLFILAFDAVYPDGARAFYTLFGILGWAAALRGLSNEY